MRDRVLQWLNTHELKSENGCQKFAYKSKKRITITNFLTFGLPEIIVSNISAPSYYNKEISK